MALDIIRDSRKEAKISLEKLAFDVGISTSQLSRIERGLRNPTLDQIKKIAARLGLALEDFGEIDFERSVPLVGYVGAGALAVLFSEGDNPNEMVPAPEGATDKTVAAEIRGDSLGELFDRWLVFYDDVHERPAAGLMKKLCVVGLPDGRILVKKITKGQLPGRYNLLSNTEPPIYDAHVIWAAKVKTMMPR